MTKPFNYFEQLAGAMAGIQLFATMVAEIDLDEIARRMDRADSLGPLLDPTLWRAGHVAMDRQRDLICAAADFKSAIKKASPEFAEFIREVLPHGKAGEES